MHLPAFDSRLYSVYAGSVAGAESFNKVFDFCAAIDHVTGLPLPAKCWLQKNDYGEGR
jgi:hypothetical protein